MKFILILMMTSYGGSIEAFEFNNKLACENAFESLKAQDARLKGGCFPQFIQP
jgi:hypothetical protein